MNSSKYYKSGKYIHIYKPKGNISTHIHLLQDNNRNTRKRCETCSKLIMKTLKRRQWRCSGVFNVNCDHIPHLFLLFQFLIWACIVSWICKWDINSQLKSFCISHRWTLGKHVLHGIHYEKYHSLTWFLGVEVLWKGTVSA